MNDARRFGKKFPTGIGKRLTPFLGIGAQFVVGTRTLVRFAFFVGSYRTLPNQPGDGILPFKMGPGHAEELLVRHCPRALA